VDQRRQRDPVRVGIALGGGQAAAAQVESGGRERRETSQAIGKERRLGKLSRPSLSLVFLKMPGDHRDRDTR